MTENALSVATEEADEREVADGLEEAGNGKLGELEFSTAKDI